MNTSKEVPHERFVDRNDGMGLVDTQIHPRVLAAQKLFEQRQRAAERKRAKRGQ